MNNEDVREARSDRSQPPVHDDRAEIEELRQRIQALQSDVAHADRRLRAAVRQRPFVALGTALAAGFVLGRIIGRSRGWA